jgi:GT2 family glycosyltransferase
MSVQPPNVSVVIPALDEATNLSRCLPVVRSQLPADAELIVVDNGSHDHTSEVARSHGARVVHEPVRGRARARNAGIRHARGALLVFLDADCLPGAGWLERLLAPFEDPRVGCVGGEILGAHFDTELGRYLAQKGHLSQAVNFAHPFLPFAASANVAFRRAVLDEIGLFDESLPDGEDADLCWQMQLYTDYKIVLAPTAIVRHLQRFSARTLVRQKRRHAYAAVLLYKKYRPHRLGELRSFKHIYWEYRSIIRRALAYFLRPVPATHGYQLLLEIGEKLGRLEGSLRHRVWYL